MRFTLHLTAALLGCVGCARTAEKQDPKQPNIILILADDLGYNDLGFNGAYIETPTLDKLALEGVRMESFYTCPVSSPTRVGTLTGRYPIRMGLMRSALAPQHKMGIPVEEKLIPEMLAEAGYDYRAIFGKWHVGYNKKEYLPLQRGFTEFLGCHSGAVNYFNANSYGVKDWHKNNEPIPFMEGDYVTDVIGDNAVDFIQEVPKDEPYFLYLPFTAPHGPHQAKEEDINKYIAKTENKKEAVYAAMIDCLDQNVAKVVQAVKERGDFDNTLFIFYSDNGGLVGRCLPTQMQAGKFSTFEGGIRVAAFSYWKDGGITGGRQVDTQMGYIDIYPTIKAAAYGKRAENIADANPLDGINILPILQGKTKGEPRMWFSYTDQGLEAFERFSINYGSSKLYVNRPAKDNKNYETIKPELQLFELDMMIHADRKHTLVKNPDLKDKLYEEVDKFMKLQPENVVSRYDYKRKEFVIPENWVPTE